MANGTCKATIMDSATAAYRVANEYCGLDVLPETFNAEQCEAQDARVRYDVGVVFSVSCEQC